MSTVCDMGLHQNGLFMPYMYRYSISCGVCSAASGPKEFMVDLTQVCEKTQT